MKYRKKPVVIEAVEYTVDNLVDVKKFITSYTYFSEDTKQLMIQTLEGDMWASPGDMIIQGVSGEFYPCRPDIFEMTYERAEE